MQPGRLAGREIEHHRARIATQRGAVVMQDARLLVEDEAGGQALFLVDAAEELVHQPAVGIGPVLGRVADHDDRGGGIQPAAGERDRRCLQRSAGARGEAQEGHIRGMRRGQIEDLGDRQLERRRVVDLLEEVDPRADGVGAIEAAAKAEPVTLPLGELGRHVAVGDDDTRLDQPARADIVDGERVVVDLDPPDGGDGAGQPGRDRGLGQAPLPDLGVEGRLEHGCPVAHIEDRPPGAQHDRFLAKVGMVEPRQRRFAGCLDQAGERRGGAVQLAPGGLRPTLAVELARDLVRHRRIKGAQPPRQRHQVDSTTGHRATLHCCNRH